MEWTNEDTEYLRTFCEGSKLDCDEIRFKQIIKKELIEDKYIIHVLNNQELEEAEAEPDEYFGINILPYYLIKPTQTESKNFLCYELNSQEGFSETRKIQRLVFYILVHQGDGNIIETETGLARHDLLAALVMEHFNWTNLFGERIHCVSDQASVIDDEYSCRTLIFEQSTDNNVVKTPIGSGSSRMINRKFR